METIYIEHDNCIVHRGENHLVIKKQGRSVGSVPLINTSCIVVLGGVQITSHALNLLFEKNIDVVYTSKSGQIKGRIQSQTGGGALVRLAQHGVFLNFVLRSGVAGNIVRGKIQNQIRLLEKYKRYYSLENFGGIIRKMNLYSSAATRTQDIDEIMGYEGVSAKLYWECFRTLIKNQAFTRREYRPAPDYVNSALNLGYSFLANEITACLSAEKFDTEIGFLHSIHYGRASLALDMMEEFRVPFVDAWLLKQFNRRILNETHFLDASCGFYLSEEGFRRFIGLYHEHKESGDWQRHFREQARELKKSVMSGGSYTPYQWQ
jgi:CRISPR-associated protein Cas1